jgi:uncharacterized protein
MRFWAGVALAFGMVVYSAMGSGLSPFVSPAMAQSATAPRIESVTLVTESTSTFVTAEIADTDETRARGLMFRHRLPDGHGMLFDFVKPRPVSMWMKDTYMPLDMFFVRADGTIAAIAENTVPKSLDTISVQEPVKAVLELAGGAARKYGIKVNDRVVHRLFDAK